MILYSNSYTDLHDVLISVFALSITEFWSHFVHSVNQLSQ